MSALPPSSKEPEPETAEGSTPESLEQEQEYTGDPPQPDVDGDVRVDVGQGQGEIGADAMPVAAGAALSDEDGVTLTKGDDGATATDTATDADQDGKRAQPSPPMQLHPQQRRESAIWSNNLPPSPPLTRSSTSSSVRRDAALGVGVAERGADADASIAVIPAEEHDLGDGDASHVEEQDEPSSWAPPKAQVVRQPSRIDLDAKMEPQPWDLVDPPPSNNIQTNGEYYASLTGQKYNTLTSSRARAMIPKSSYYFGPPPSDSAYGTQPVGQIGLHHPREILRVERDYTGGELIQFAPIYPLELEGRLTPTQFLESINAINEVLISAHSLRYAFLDNMLAVFTLQLSRLIVTPHYEKQMRRLQELIRELNVRVYNPAGLNILWPRRVAFLFMEIEYY